VTPLLSVILLIVTFVTVALVSGNNLSVCVGPAVGSRTLSRRMGALLGAVGFSLGLLSQGSAMTKSVELLLPNAAVQLRLEALLVAMIVFIIALVVRVPISLGMSLVGLLVGLSVARDIAIDAAFVTKVAIMWFVAPFIALIFSFLLIRVLTKNTSENFWRRLQAYKVLLIILSFSTSYVLGSNTLGLIVATGGFDLIYIVGAVAAVFVGAFYLSEGQIRRVSQELFLMRYPNATASLVTTTILVEFATILNVPLSNTQAMTAAVFGTGLSYKTKFVSLRPFLMIILSWVVVPLLSFIIGLVIGL